MNLQQAKQRFGIIGNALGLDRAIETALRVAATDLSVLITGESGTGKERMPQIIHHNSARKHNAYIAVNCGAIPEGTIDSELFGHEKGSFTGAHETRKGYFEVADSGTIFLDEVAELPVSTQVRLLRVLETGEFMKVGSSKVQKTDVRIVAATNVNILEAIKKGRFREDLYYRLNTVPIAMPALRERKGDVHLLFRKFAADFAEKYRMPAIKLSDDAVELLEGYHWPGNIRQLKNITEQVSVIENQREISAATLVNYLPAAQANKLPMLSSELATDFTEREILYKVLFDMRGEINELKKLIGSAISGSEIKIDSNTLNSLISLKPDAVLHPAVYETAVPSVQFAAPAETETEHVVVEESLSIQQKEKELIQKALEKYHGRRRFAASELGISERTLYRKIKEYDLI